MTDEELKPGLIALARALGRYQASVDIRRRRDAGPDETGPDDGEDDPQVDRSRGFQGIDSVGNHGSRG